MDANGREKIGMLMRLLETIHQEVSRILSEEEDNPARSAVPKETGFCLDLGQPAGERFLIMAETDQ